MMKKQTSFSPRSGSTDASSALHILLSPDGYYTYLGVQKPAPSHKSLLPKSKESDDKTATKTAEGIDKTAIQKNYRKLSLRLHPDRPTGNEEAFRVLERAKNVLLSDKLRKQYDLLGLDLEEEDHADESHQEDEDGNTADEKKEGSSGPDGILGHMASATVAAFLQMAVRTAMMAAASLFITRWKYTTIPAILFLSYTSLQIYKARNKETTGPLITTFDIISPLCISTGMLLMFFGRSDSEQGPWTKTFWAGEALVMTLFCLNTLSSREATTLRPSLPLSLGLYFIFGLLALYIRGKGWRYISCLSIELGCALVAVLVFPMMEMLMETLIDEKLKKVGERVRLYSKVMEETYQAKLEELEKKNNSQESSSYVGGPSVIVTEELD